MNNPTVLIDGTIPGELLRANPGGKSLVLVGKTAEWIENSRITTPGQHLTPSDSPTIRREYSGIMGERANKRR